MFLSSSDFPCCVSLGHSCLCSPLLHRLPVTLPFVSISCQRSPKNFITTCYETIHLLYVCSSVLNFACLKEEESRRREHHRTILADIYRNMSSITYQTVWAKVQSTNGIEFLSPLPLPYAFHRFGSVDLAVVQELIDFMSSVSFAFVDVYVFLWLVQVLYLSQHIARLGVPQLVLYSAILNFFLFVSAHFLSPGSSSFGRESWVCRQWRPEWWALRLFETDSHLTPATLVQSQQPLVDLLGGLLRWSSIDDGQWQNN